MLNQSRVTTDSIQRAQTTSRLHQGRMPRGEVVTGTSSAYTDDPPTNGGEGDVRESYDNI
jgi:hypothetical protein